MSVTRNRNHPLPQCIYCHSKWPPLLQLGLFYDVYSRMTTMQPLWSCLRATVYMYICSLNCYSSWKSHSCLSPSLSTTCFRVPSVGYVNCTVTALKDQFEPYFSWVEYAKYMGQISIRHVTFDEWYYENSVSGWPTIYHCLSSRNLSSLAPTLLTPLPPLSPPAM